MLTNEMSSRPIQEQPRCCCDRRINIPHQQIISYDPVQEGNGRALTFHHHGVHVKSWPNFSGGLLILTGLLTACLGILEVFPIPAIVNTNVDVRYGLHLANCFGANVFCGTLLVFTGSLAVRAGFSRRIALVQTFFVMAILSLLTNSCFVLMQLYCATLVTRAEYKEIHETYYGFAEIHMLGICFSLMGLMELSGVVTRYYDDVLFGEVQLLRSIIKIVLPCWNFERSPAVTAHTYQWSTPSTSNERPAVTVQPFQWSTPGTSNESPAVTAQPVQLSTPATSNEHPAVTAQPFQLSTLSTSNERPAVTARPFQLSIQSTSNEHPAVPARPDQLSTPLTSSQRPAVTAQPVQLSTPSTSSQHPAVTGQPVQLSTPSTSSQRPAVTARPVQLSTPSTSSQRPAVTARPVQLSTPSTSSQRPAVTARPVQLSTPSTSSQRPAFFLAS